MKQLWEDRYRSNNTENHFQSLHEIYCKNQ